MVCLNTSFPPLFMANDFQKWHQDTPVSNGETAEFKTKALHVRRHKEKPVMNKYKAEAARDRVIFLYVMGTLLAVGSVFAIVYLTSGK